MRKENGVVSYTSFQSFVLKTGSRVLSEGLSNSYRPEQAEGIIRRVDFAVLYHSGEETLQALGARYQLSRARAGDLVREGVAFLREHFVDESNVIFDGKAVARRPLSIEARRRISQSHGGASRAVEASVEAGEPVSTIVREFGRKLTTARQTLKRQGVEVPYVRTPGKANKEVIAQLAFLRDYTRSNKDRKVQAALKRVTYQVHRRAKGLLATVSDLAREAGLRLPRRKGDLDQFARVLIWAGIPSRRISLRRKNKKPYNYHVVHVSDKQRGVKAFRVAPELEGYRKIGPLARVC